jgi:hypothetical protein
MQSANLTPEDAPPAPDPDELAEDPQAATTSAQPAIASEHKRTMRTLLRVRG